MRPGRHRRTRTLSLVLFLIGLSLVVAACGEGSDALPTAGETTTTEPPPSTSETTTGPSPTDQTAMTTAEGHIVVSHQNLPQARSELDAARERWAEAGPDSYGLSVRIACECDMWQSESVVLEGETIESYFLFQPEFADESDIPGTVDELLATADRLLADLEANPENVARDECDGMRFSLVVDADTGFPYEFGNDTPCDGGATWISSLVPMGDAPPERIQTDGYADVDLDEPHIVPGMVAGLVVSTAHRFDGGADIEAVVLTDVGMPCGGAADVDACRAAVDELLSDPIGAALLSVPCTMCLEQHVAIVATEGEQVRLVTTAELVAVLGPIDTPVEAVLVAGVAGLVREVDDEWEILSNRVVATCAPVIERGALTRVTEDGLVYEVDHWYAKYDGVCI